ncbi:hypothetical protein BS17DRAFT_736681 [Gyrodon lividus]|nr:hypothetical protein BS17DRAFT_736681 [Gyrodon lividus]
MSISSPKQLVDEFKKSGEFDRLRRELLAQFQRSERTVSFKSRVDDIARQRLASDQKLINMPYDVVYHELMGEIDRYPIVERAVAEAPLLSDTTFAAAIRTSVQRILDDSNGTKGNYNEAGGSSASLAENTRIQGSSYRSSVNYSPPCNGNGQDGSTC